MTEYPLVQPEPLRQFCIEALKKAGIPDEDACIVAGIQLEADLRGVHSHGSIAIIGYAGRIKAGGNKANPNIHIISEAPAYALVDGDDGLGQIVAYRAMEICIRKAKATGLACVGVNNSSHFGAAASYAMMALKENLIGVATTNAAAIIPPTGGKTGIFGTNPISVAVPTGHSFPVVLDMATSTVATQKIVQAYREGQKIPAGWGMDKEGNTTTDPLTALTSGIQPPLGGYKGYGLAMIVEILAGVMTSARFGRATEGKNWALGNHLNVGHFFIALNPAMFLPLDEFKSRVEQLITDVKSVQLIEGTQKVYVPGEIEWEKRNKYLKEGIPYPPAALAQLEKFGQEIGVGVKLR
ncbi:MAG: Ldh family oxidoreductase [Dehalococcoidales bacterium]|nr:Ldh family oxidoreductase [Dehalococcoidales bacterium]